MRVRVDVNNFRSHSLEEYRNNLLSLGIETHDELVGEQVYYVKSVYGIHIVERWDDDRAEYLLNLDGQRFWSNPFRIKLIE